MKKYSYFECSAQLSQLQARLDKNGYLSKGSLPSSVDAKVFLLFERLRKIPRRANHPNLYHWYILMKQFSLRTIQIWAQQVVAGEQDKFINECLMKDALFGEKENNLAINNSNKETNHGSNCARVVTFLSTPKNGCKRRQNNEDLNQNPVNRSNILPNSLKYIPPEGQGFAGLLKGELNSPTFQMQYVMEMQLKQSCRRTYGLRQRLQQQKLQLISFQTEQSSIRVVFRAEAEQCQKLKDRISKWEEISNLRFRKEKRFNTKTENKSQKTILSSDMVITTNS